jgi:hypothetical protein
MRTTLLNVILQNLQINTLQNLQSVNYAGFASLKQCRMRKLQTMHCLQIMIFAKSANCQQCSGSIV